MKNNKSLALQASVLASAGLITKIIGFIYRIPMANILGNTGNGIYSVAFGIYSIVLTLSSYSMPISISKLISEKMADENEIAAQKIFRISLLVSVIVGAIASFGLYFGADCLAHVYNKTGLQMPLKILAPTTFIVAVLGCFRGYFQGYGNMVPTALTQIVEQIINAVVSIIAASQITFLFVDIENKAALRAAGGTLGTCAGALVALLCIFYFYTNNKSKSLQHIQISSVEAKRIFTSLLVLMIPIILSQTIYQIGYTIDDYIFAKVMGMKGFHENYITSLQGVFNTQYTQMINLPIGVATAFGVSVIPRITSAFIKKEKNEISENIGQLIKMTSIVVFPATAGLTICSEEIMSVLFPGLGDLHSIAVNLLLYGSISAVFYSFSTISASILQGCNRFKVPVINAAISLAVHIVLVVFLIYSTNLQTYALLIGDVVFPMLILILNVVAIKKNVRAKINIKDNILKPIVGSIIMGFVIIAFKMIADIFTDSNLVLLFVEVIVGLVVYGYFMYRTGLFRIMKR